MAVIDMDSHLRDGYFLDEIYDLRGEFAALRPKKLNDPEDIRETEFDHAFTPSSSPHDWIYYTKTNWLGGPSPGDGRRAAPLRRGARLQGRVFEEFPDSHVLMATDYPHFDSEFPNTIEGIRNRGDLTDRQKDMILGENAQALLGM